MVCILEEDVYRRECIEHPVLTPARNAGFELAPSRFVIALVDEVVEGEEEDGVWERLE